MKLIKCVVREERIDETIDALRDLDVSGLTVSRVLGYGTCERHAEFTAASSISRACFPK